MKKLLALYAFSIATVIPAAATCPVVGAHNTQQSVKQTNRKDHLRSQLTDLQEVINNLISHLNSIDPSLEITGELQEFLTQVENALRSLDGQCSAADLDNIAMVSEGLEVQVNTLKKIFHAIAGGN